MPVTISNPVIRTDPVPGYSFAVLLKGVIRGWFTECSGITVERQVKEYPEGGVNDHLHQLPGRVTRARVTLKHGLAGDKLWSWFQQGRFDGQVERHHILIVVYDGTLLPVTWWSLFDAYPAKWVGPSFKSDSQDVMIEEVEFVHTGSSGAGPASILQRAANGTKTKQAITGQEIDLLALANKVYALFKDELRVEREREGRNR